MQSTSKGNPAPSVYIKGLSAAPTDPLAILAYLSRELDKVAAATRQLDERLTAGHL